MASKLNDSLVVKKAFRMVCNLREFGYSDWVSNIHKILRVYEMDAFLEPDYVLTTMVKPHVLLPSAQF